MSQIVYLESTSPLSRFYVYPVPFCGPVPARSVEQLFGYLMAIQEQRPDVAANIMAPDGIYELEPMRICSLLETERIGQSGSCVFARKEIYRAIWLDEVVRHSSPLRQALQQFMVEDDDDDPFFVVCNSGNDRVWGCGKNKSQAENVELHKLTGANLFGAEVLGDAFRRLTGDQSVHPKWDVATLVAGPVGFNTIDEKTCLLVGDSMVKYVKHIDGGKIKPISGGLFSDVAEFLFAQGHQDLASYAVVIIHCGVNVLQMSSPLAVEVEILCLQEVLKYVRSVNPACDLVLSLPLRHEDLEVASFNAKVRSSLGDVHNLQFLEAVDPFWEDGRRQMEFYNVNGNAGSDPFHLNPCGTEVLWSKMFVLVPRLKQVRMNLAKYHYQADTRPGVRSMGRHMGEEYAVLDEVMEDAEAAEDDFDDADEIVLLEPGQEADDVNGSMAGDVIDWDDLEITDEA